MNSTFLGYTLISRDVFTTLYFLRNLRIGPKARVFVHGKYLQPCVMNNPSLLSIFMGNDENEVLFLGLF
jgi:hypothetical protein